MKTNSGAITYTAEDGATFLNLQEAQVHEAFIYIGKTIQAFGPEQVRAAVAAVEPLDPFFPQAVCAIARILQDVQTAIPVGPKTPRIHSVNAPHNIAGPARASVEFEVKPAEPAPAETPPREPETPAMPSGEPERVTRPDTRPREPGSDDAGQRGAEAVEGALFPAQTAIGTGSTDLVTDRQAAAEDALPGNGKSVGDDIDARFAELPDDPEDEALGDKARLPGETEEDEAGARGVIGRLAALSPRTK